MSQFDKLCEEYIGENFTTLKKTITKRYPKQIHLSDEFKSALRNEYQRLKVDQDPDRPIRDLPNKFLKALQFHLTEFDEEPSVNENTEEYEAKGESDDEYPKKGKDPKKEQKRRSEIPQENME